MRVRRKIKEFYKTNIIIDSWGLEEERKFIVRKMLGKQIASILLLLIGVIGFTAVKNLSFKLGLSVGLLVVVYCWWFYDKILERKIREFKECIVNDVFTFLEANLSYRSEGKVPQKAFFKSGIIKEEIDKYEGREYFKGEIGVVDLQFSQVAAKSRVKDSFRRVKWNKLFEGLVFIANFPASFESDLVIKTDPAERMLENLSYSMQRTAGIVETNLPEDKAVKLNHPELAKRFKVWSTDKKKAQEILTPNLCKKLLGLEKEVSHREHMLPFLSENKMVKKEIYFSLRGSKLYVGVPFKRKKIFQPRLFLSYTSNFKSLKYHFDVLRQVVEIIEELKNEGRSVSTQNK